jgi:hypothetical protein
VPATEETILRILFIGDVVGRVGREAIRIHLPGCLSQWKIDLCVVNVENAADQGFGITQPIFKELLAAGADAVTSATLHGIGGKLFNSSKMPLTSSDPSTTFPARPDAGRR